jgi:hypothetical protein
MKKYIRIKNGWFYIKIFVHVLELKLWLDSYKIVLLLLLVLHFFHYKKQAWKKAFTFFIKSLHDFIFFLTFVIIENCLVLFFILK